MSSRPRTETFRERLRRQDRLLGTFVKTPHPSAVEVLGHSALDCLCLDAEHAPFDRGTLDLAILAGRATDMPVLVRIANPAAAEILTVLDLGATGVVVPHVTTTVIAQAVAAACRYGPHGRGYAGSTRAAAYGTRSMSDNIARANAEVAAIVQIEDAEALDEIDDIASVDGIDALFIGRMDLTVSLGARSPHDTQVIEAVRHVCAAGRRHGRTVGMFTPTVEEAHQWFDSGATFFLLGSEQQWILQGARTMREIFGG